MSSQKKKAYTKIKSNDRRHVISISNLDLLGSWHGCILCKRKLHNLCLQRLLGIDDKPETWLCGGDTCDMRQDAGNGQGATAKSLGGRCCAGLACIVSAEDLQPLASNCPSCKNQCHMHCANVVRRRGLCIGCLSEDEDNGEREGGEEEEEEEDEDEEDDEEDKEEEKEEEEEEE